MPHEPKKKHSKARKRTRRASISLKSIGMLVCGNCQSPILPHQVCKNCGFYDGKKILDTTKTQVTRA